MPDTRIRYHLVSGIRYLASGIWHRVLPVPHFMQRRHGAGRNARSTCIHAFRTTVVIVHGTFCYASFTNLIAEFTHFAKKYRIPGAHAGSEVTDVCAVATNLYAGTQSHA
jgi:hypothetical protein